MRIGRTLAPALAPIYARDILAGLRGLVHGQAELSRFKDELKDYYGMNHCFLVSSGKTALTLILLALKDLFPGREYVLIPAFSCYSVPSAIVRAGLKIKLCDINPANLDFDFEQFSQFILSSLPSSSVGTAYASGEPSSPEEGLSYQRHHFNAISDKREDPTPGLLAIVPTHLFGFPSDIERIHRMVADPAVTIVEDAAQAMGGESKGRRLGTLGDVSFFSLGRGKALSTFEGGVILTNRKDIADRIEFRIQKLGGYGLASLLSLILQTISLTTFSYPLFFWLPSAVSVLKLGETIYDPAFKMKKMSPFQAGLAKDWVKKLRAFQKIRRENAELWCSIRNDNRIHHFCPKNKTYSPLIRFPVYVENAELRDRILCESRKRGLGIMPTYPDSLDVIFEYERSKHHLHPVAKVHANKLITLPVHPFVTKKDQVRIAELLSGIIQFDVFLQKG